MSAPDYRRSDSSPVSSRPSARVWLQFSVGILVTLLAFWFLASKIDWRQFWIEVISIPVWVLALVVAVYWISMVVRAACWQTLLQRKVSLGQAVLALNEGYILNNLLPFRLGELGRAVLLGRRSNLGTFYILSTIVVERAFDMAIAVSLLLLVLPQIVQQGWVRVIALLLLLGITLGLLALYLAGRYRAWLEGRMAAWSQHFAVIRWVQPILQSLLDGFSVINRFQYFALSFGLLALSWLLAIVRDWVLLQELVAGAPVWWAALAISGANLGGALPSAAASLGTFEAGAVSALEQVGVASEKALAYALIVHVIHLISSSLIGAYALSREGKSLAKIVAELRSTVVKR